METMKIRNKNGEFCTAKEFWLELLDGSSQMGFSAPDRLGTISQPNTEFPSQMAKFKNMIHILEKTSVKTDIDDNIQGKSFVRIDNEGIFRCKKFELERYILDLEKQYQALLNLSTTFEVEG